MTSASVVRRLVLLGVPMFLAGWMLLHPWPYDDIEGKLLPIAGWWTTLHAVQFVLFCFAGAAVWLLVGGLRGLDATVARVGAVVFAISYNAGDAVAGIATGILAGRAAGAPCYSTLGRKVRGGGGALEDGGTGGLRGDAPELGGFFERGSLVFVSARTGNDLQGYICEADGRGLLLDVRDPSGDPGDYEFLPWSSIERVITEG